MGPDVSAQISRRRFLGGLSSAALPIASQPPKQPNFLIILADDMGYSDAGCYGGGIATPHLDKLAAGGLRFTQAYSTARCGPSRACLLTGHYAQQTACDVMTPGNVPEWTRFLPQHLRPLGYRSYHSGKWHIRFRPVAGAGFDRSYRLNDQGRFFSPAVHFLDDEKLPPVGAGEGYYATRAIADHAVRFLAGHAAEHKAAPFCLYLAFTAPHFPLHALQDDIDLYRDKFADGWDAERKRRHDRMRRMGLVQCALPPLEPDMRPAWNTSDAELVRAAGSGEVTHAVPWASLTPEQKRFQRMKMAIHAAMITRMDQEIGRVLEQLRGMGAYEDTLILFLSDNGASSEQLIRADGHDSTAAPGSARTHLCLGPGWASAANAPFRLHKSWVHEGGISSPLIAHWPWGISDRGKLRRVPCHFVDVLPTLVDLAGGSSLAFTGRSIAPALANDRGLTRDYIYFHHSNNRALRVGDWKLVSAGAAGPWELYDMRVDRGEMKNLAAAEPNRAARMAARWKEIDTEFVNRRESAAPMPKERF